MIKHITPMFFDLETQYLFSDFNTQDPSKLKVAVAGILKNNHHKFFHEEQVKELIIELKNADLIVGHNLLNFDYNVLRPYTNENLIEKLYPKTFDMIQDLKKITGCLIGLDDLCKRNVGMSKTIDSKKIPKMWRDGKHQEVRDYLLNDLKMTKEIYEYGTKHKKLKYEHKEYGESFGEREAKVNW